MTQNKPRIRPFLKWAGNKWPLVERIKETLPDGSRLVEPFVGSGAVFLNTEYDTYLLSDANADLINIYKTLKRDGRKFIDYCRELFITENNESSRYYALRDEFNQSADKYRRAALFLYLNRHGYNGLCRYNSKGQFNVPFGRYVQPYFPEREMLAFFHKAKKARFQHTPFQKTILKARPGDVIYCDPPYVPLSASANFTAYSAGGFDLIQQEELARLAARTARAGIPVLISNHNTEFTRKAYRGAKISRFQVQRYISCNGSNRDKAEELLAFFAAP